MYTDFTHSLVHMDHTLTVADIMVHASFTSSVVKHGKEPIHMKLTPNERKES